LQVDLALLEVVAISKSVKSVKFIFFIFDTLQFITEPIIYALPWAI